MNVRRETEKFIRSCFSKIWNKQFLIFLFFLVLSASFWLFQALNETYERTFSVPVELKNVPGNVVITTEPPEFVSLTLRDKGVALYNYVYGHKFQPLAINYNDHSSSKGHVRILSGEVLRQLKQQLTPGSQVVGIKPDTLEFYYNFGLSKRVPVKFQGSISTNPLFHLSQQKISHDSVTVYAAKNILDTITAAHLKPVYVTELDDTLTMQAAIQPIKGAKFMPSDVTLSLFVDRLVEKTVQVPIQSLNFPTDRVLRTFPSKVNVTFQVGMRNYRSVSAADFVLAVDYEELLRNTPEKCHPVLQRAPESASHIRIHPQDVEYVIEEISQ